MNELVHFKMCELNCELVNVETSELSNTVCVCVCVCHHIIRMNDERCGF